MTTATDVRAEGKTRIGFSMRPRISRELMWWWDLTRLVVSPTFLGLDVPQGDGAPVILTPGFWGSSIALLYRVKNRWLQRIGYRTFPCGLALNISCPNSSTQTVCEAIDKAAEETGRKVHLIGHSLGASLNKTAAQWHPDKVATIISIAGTLQGAMVHPFVHLAAQLTIPQRCHGDCQCGFHQSLDEDPPTQISRLALYTPRDGVMEPKDCLETEGGQNIEIPDGTHTGLIVNRTSCQETARFLADHPAEEIASA